MTFFKIPNEEYFLHKGISSHMVMTFFSGEKYKSVSPEIAMFGTLFHAYFLEGKEVYDSIVSSEAEKLQKAGFDMQSLSAKVLGLCSSVIKEDLAMLEGCKTEVAGFAQVRPKGWDRLVTVKGKFDAINEDKMYVLDIKTTSSLSGFNSSIDKYNYHIQAAFYLMLASICTKKTYKDFYWLVVEKKSGKTKLVRCSDELVSKGYAQIKEFFDMNAIAQDTF